MEIDINQRKVAIGDKYDIYTQGAQTHYAKSKLFRLLSRIDLMTSGSEQVLLTLARQWYFFKISYNIEFGSGTVAEFRTLSFWRRHYRCRVGADTYDIFGHRGRRVSVFRNFQQVAWWDQEAVSWFEGDNYKIIADDDCDPNLLMAFCLILDDATSNQDDSGMVKFNIGYWGPEQKPFDSNWMPNMKRGRPAMTTDQSLDEAWR